MTVEFSCPRCGKDYALDASLAGRKARCKRCEMVMIVPAPEAPVDEPDSARRPEGDAREPSSRTTRPRPDDPFGMEEVEALPPRIEVEPRAVRRPDRASGSKGSALGNLPRPRFVHGVLAWWLLMPGLAALSFLMDDGAFRCSQVMVWAGIVLMPTAGVWFFVTAFREGVTRGLLALFVPFYWLYHLFDSWSETRRPFWTGLAGVASIVAGSLFYGVTGDDVGERALMSWPGSAASRRVAIVEDELPLRPPAVAEAMSGEEALGRWRAFADARERDRPIISKLVARKKKAMIRLHGQDAIAIVSVDGIFDAAAFEAVEKALRPFAGPGPDDFFAYSLVPSGVTAGMSVMLAPATDREAIAGALDFCQIAKLTPSGRDIYAVAKKDLIPAQLSSRLGEVSAIGSKASRPVAPSAGRSPSIAAPSVRPATPAGPAVLPASGDLELPFPRTLAGLGGVAYPMTNSRFVAIGGNNAESDSRESWDLKERRRIGVIAGAIRLNPNVAIGPDGTSMAGVTADQQAVEVWSFETGGLVRRIDASTIVDAVFFVGPDRVLISTPFQKTYYLTDVATGRGIKTVVSPVAIDRESPAIDPGGQALALASGSQKSAGIYRLETAKLTANWTVPPAQPYAMMTCRGMVFSPDGTELAGLFEDSKFTRIMAWGPSGQVVTNALIANQGPDAITRPSLYAGRPLEWLPDQNGWMVYGQSIVDKQTGKRAWTIPRSPDDSPKHPRRLLETGELLSVGGPRLAPVLRSVRLPLDEIDRAIRAVRSRE